MALHDLYLVVFECQATNRRRLAFFIGDNGKTNVGKLIELTGTSFGFQVQITAMCDILEMDQYVIMINLATLDLQYFAAVEIIKNVEIGTDNETWNGGAWVQAALRKLADDNFFGLEHAELAWKTVLPILQNQPPSEA